MRHIKDIKLLMEAIVSSMPLSKAIGMYIPLEPDGSGLCPWHAETIGSFKVTDSKSIWKCWGACNGEKGRAGTNIIGFIQTQFGLSFMEAVDKFIQDTGFDFSEHFREPTNEERWKDFRQSVNKVVAVACYAKLNEISVVNDMFVRGKGIKQEILEQFLIGYSTNVDFILQVLHDNNIEETHIEQLDLNRYEMWNNRIVYPIMDEFGQITHFRNRTLSDDSVKFMGTLSTSPLHPPVLPLYGIHIARRYIRQNDGILSVVEGQNDVLSMQSHGILNTAGSMGNALSEHHFPLLEKIGVKKVILMYDGDNGGREGARHFAEGTRYSGDIIVEIAELPDTYDPDDLIREQGVEAIDKITSKAKFYLNYYFDNVDVNTDEIVGKYMFLHHVKNRVLTLSGIHKHMAFTEISERLSIPRDVVDDYFKSESTIDLLHSVDAEATVINCMIRDHTFRLSALDMLEPKSFYLNKNTMLFAMLRDMEAEGKPIDVDTTWLEIQRTRYNTIWSKDDYDVLLRLPTNNPHVYLGEVADKYTRRKADAAADKIKIDIRDSTKNVNSVLDGINDQMTSLMVSRRDIMSPQENARGIEKTLEFIKEQMQNPGAIPGLHLGPDFTCLTEAIGGLRKATMVLVGGLPGVGKTSITQKWAMYQSVILREPVLWIALEMQREQLDIRNMSILSVMHNEDTRTPSQPISTFEMERGLMTPEKAQRMYDVAKIYKNSPFYAICAGSKSVQEVTAIVRYYKKTMGIRAVYIDYAQLLTCEGMYDDDWKMQKSTSKYILEGISRDMELPVVVLSQLSRTALATNRGSSDDLPGGANVAGSMQYWADCDAFIAPFEKTRSQVEHWANMGEYGINLDKNRNGSEGLIHMQFNGSYVYWYELPSQGSPMRKGR